MGFFRRRSERGAVTPRPPVPSCSCGTPLDLVDMHYGFQLPDEVFALPQEDRASRTRGLAKVFVLDGSRGFVRTLLPVRLDHGSVTFGIWLEIPADQAQAAVRLWEEPGYASLTFSGTVANLLPPWNEALLGARATARPESPDALPVVDGGDPVVQRLLTRPWPRDDIVAALPGLGHEH